MSRQFIVGSTLVAALILIVAPSSMAVTIVSQFPAPVLAAPNNWVEGLAWDGSTLWFSNGFEIHQLDPATGATLSKFSVSDFVNDLVWINGELWGGRAQNPQGGSTDPEIVRFDPATGNELGTISTADQGVPEGLTYDGQVVIFSVDGPPAKVFELDPATGAVLSERASNVRDAEALAFSDDIVWEGGKDEGEIHKVDRATGTKITSFQTPGIDTHGLAFDGTYLWASSYEAQMIYQFDISDVNVEPTLTYVGAGGYQTDGVDPDSGGSTTTFDYRVVYTDPDNDAPLFVVVHILQDGTEIGGSPFAMANLGDLTYNDGAAYSYQTTLPAAPNYSYYFAAADALHLAIGAATIEQSGPVVADVPPTLEWTGEPGYTDDGLEPEIGQPRTTRFEFRVLYTSTLPAQYVRVHILKKGVPINNSPFDMATTDPTPYDGAIYTYERTLARSRKFSYYFQASDGSQAASGPPTTATDGPIVGNRVPTLAWTGQPGFESDGVSPDTGTVQQQFGFRVLYTDADRDWPALMKLHIARGAGEIDGSPFDLARVPGSKPRDGVIYRKRLALSRGKNYTYWFEARDAYEPATGLPTTAQDGPIVNSPPYLEWASYGAFRTDGVKPNEATGRTRCEFRVVYRDLDNDPPTYVRLELRRGKKPTNSSPFRMLPGNTRKPRNGRMFRRAVPLSPGVYSYRFAASDGFGQALGVPTQWKRGPIIHRATAAQVTSLTAVPAGPGAQISFVLSAPASVEARILNVAGRPVRGLPPREFDGGVNSLIWDGKGAGGLSAPSGVYIISVIARDEEGGESRATGRITLRR